jgi:hypothetical protein
MQKRSEKNAPYFDIGSLPLGENVPVDKVEEVPEEKSEAGGLLNLRAEDDGQVSSAIAYRTHRTTSKYHMHVARVDFT